MKRNFLFTILFFALALNPFFAQNNALQFDGSNDYVNAAFLPRPANYTIEAWVQVNNLGPRAIVSWSANAAPQFSALAVDGGYLRYYQYNNGYQIASFVPFYLLDNEWHHIACTFSSSPGFHFISFYVDGSMIATDYGVNPAVPDLNSTRVGSLHWFGSQLWPYSGGLDEVRVWNTLRTAEEISANKDIPLCGNENGLVLYYPMDQGTGGGNNAGLTTADDLSSSNNDGTLVNFALNGNNSNWVAGPSAFSNTWYVDNDNDGFGNGLAGNFCGFQSTYSKNNLDCNDNDANVNPGRNEVLADLLDNNCNGSQDENNALYFDGVNDVVQVNSFGAAPANFTIEAWFKDIGGTDYENIVGWVGNRMGRKQEILVGTQFDGTLRYGNFDYYNGVFFQINSTTNVRDGQWHHVAAVTQGNSLYLFVDGALEASGTAPVNNTVEDYVSFLQIGYQPHSTEFFTGMIDEVRIWNTARTSDEIYAARDVTLCGNENGLIAYYPFDQGTANGNNAGIVSLDDISSGNRDGILNSFKLSGNVSNWVAGAPINHTWYADNDEDGFGGGAPVNIPECGLPSGYSRYNLDCSDLDAAVKPDVSERLGDGIDNNCNNLQNENHALNFDGINDVVIAGTNPVLETENGTVEMWIYPRSLGRSQTFICYRSTDGLTTRWLFNFTANLQFMGFWNGTGYELLPNSFVANQWQHFAAVDDGTDTKIYRNGVLMGAFPQQFNTSATGSSLLLVMGYDIPYSEYFMGSLDEVKIWDFPKTAAEISAGMNLSNCGDENGLLTYYPFDQGIANGDNTGIVSLDDISSGNRDGVLNSFTLSGNVSNWVAGAPSIDNLWYADVDGDGAGDPNDFAILCDPTGYVKNNTDLCPNDPNKTVPGICGCGLNDAENDMDGDGVCDYEDNCPNTPNTNQADSDCDGVGDGCDVCDGGDDSVDNNNDGLPDCDNNPGFANISADWKCSNNTKVSVCYYTTYGTRSTICIHPNSINTYLNARPLSYIGTCGAASCNEAKVAFGNFETDGNYQMVEPLMVFPNPVADDLNIEIDPVYLDQHVALVLRDQLGRTIWTQQFRQLETTSIQLNVKEFGFAPGIYNLSLQSDNDVITKQVVVGK